MAIKLAEPFILVFKKIEFLPGDVFTNWWAFEFIQLHFLISLETNAMEEIGILVKQDKRVPITL